MASASNPEAVRAFVAVGLVFVLVAALLVFIARWHALRRARREANWRTFALANRLELQVEPGNWLKHGSLRITGDVAGLDLELSTYTVKAGKSRQEWARVRARGLGPAGRFGVKDKEFLDFVGGWFGRKDVEVDGGAFDKRFVVTSEPESLVSEVLDEALRRQIASVGRFVKFSYADGEAEVAWMGGNETAEQLSEAVELHARLFGAFQRAGRPGS
jgi:hypothetical protein